MSINIAVNSVIEWISKEEERNKMERILWIDEEGNVVVINLLESKSLPEFTTIDDIKWALNNGEAIKRVIDPFSPPTLVESEILKKHRVIRDRAWEIIKDLVGEEPGIYISKGRGKLLNEISGYHGVHKMTVYKYLRRYWVRGKTKNALLPLYENCGAPGEERVATRNDVKRGRPPKIKKDDPEKEGVNIDDETKALISFAAREYYDNSNKFPLSRAYDKMIQNHFNLGYRKKEENDIPILPPNWEYPSMGQFRYWYKKRQDLVKSTCEREGEKGFNLRNRAVTGDSTQMAAGPGSIYQIDATIVDVYLVSSYDRTKIIGRPVLYMVMDVFSRMVPGFYVGLEGPSWIGAMMALSNVASDKVKFCAEHGIEIYQGDWPTFYLPESILADRGEFEGFNADHLADSLNIGLATTPPYRADWKGIVEQMFRLSNLKTIHWLPGAVKERYRERGERDHRRDAILDLHQFTRIIIRMIMRHNLHHWIKDYPRNEAMIKEDVDPVPIKLWEWGMRNNMGHLQERSQEEVMLNLMPQDKASITEHGIKWRGMYYSCQRAITEQWFEKARAYGRWRVTISYDPRITDYIYLYLKGEKEIVVCELLEKEEIYKGRRLEEVLDLQEFEKIKEQLHASEEAQADAVLEAEVENEVEEADKKTQEEIDINNLSDTQRVKNIRESRAEEKERKRSEEAFILGKDKNSKESNTNNVINFSKDEDEDEKEMIQDASQKELNMLQEMFGKEDYDE